jgi:hypothetical protein
MPGGEFSWDEDDDRFVLRGPHARVVLNRTSGRWTHHIELDITGAATGSTPLIAAIETETDVGRANPARVVSPVYQELQRHEFAGDQVRGVCLLLTGHLFQHHFSAAVSLFRDPDDPRWVVFDADLADRCRAPVESLAATYQVRLGSSELAEASETAIAWSFPATCRLELRCDSPGTLALAEAGRTASRVQVLARLHPTLYTHRLRYRWQWMAETGGN